MICIFCKQDSTYSKSVEHIIPESLGNTKNVLPKGIVCDGCNDYFGRKVEKEVLSLSFFSQLRARNVIPSKKNRIPAEKLLVYHPEVESDEHESLLIRGMRINILSTPWPIATKIVSSPVSNIIVESTGFNNPPADNILVARFLAKIAVEILTQNVIESKWDLALIHSDERVEPIRKFARYGTPGLKWEYYVRKIYNEDEKFFYSRDLDTPVDVLYNYGHFFINEEMYLSLIIKGFEFTINMGMPAIGRYIQWILVNNGRSAIYTTNIIQESEQKIQLFSL